MSQITEKVNSYPFREGSQCDQILKYLQSGKSLLNWEMREKFGCLAHTRRIKEIRDAGYDVRAERVDGGVWRYWLVRDK